MKERPILFTGAMVRALLDGSKTQTRRIVKPQPPEDERIYTGLYHPTVVDRHGEEQPSAEVFGAYTQDGEWALPCPYGESSDRLWVRDTFYAFGRWETRYSEKKKRDAWHFVDMTTECDRRYQYAADNPDVPLAKGRSGAQPGWYTRPAIFMPRAACRVLRDIARIRVERLQDISEADAKAEGTFTDEQRPEEHDYKSNYWMCPQCLGTGLHNGLGANGGVIFDIDCRECDTHVKRYRHLWESINGAGSWALNPWVWVVEFRHIEKR